MSAQLPPPLAERPEYVPTIPSSRRHSFILTAELCRRDGKKILARYQEKFSETTPDRELLQGVRRATFRLKQLLIDAVPYKQPEQAVLTVEWQRAAGLLSRVYKTDVPTDFGSEQIAAFLVRVNQLLWRGVREVKAAGYQPGGVA